MIKRLTVSFLIIGTMLMGQGVRAWGGEEPHSTRAYVFPADPVYFQPGPGQEIANGYCLICHSAEYIYMQPPHSQTTWTDIVKKMKRVMGCPIPDDQIEGLASYLFQQNSISLALPSHAP